MGYFARNNKGTFMIKLIVEHWRRRKKFKIFSLSGQIFLNIQKKRLAKCMYLV